MASKGEGKKKSKGGGGHEDVKREQKLQAIVMADSFCRTFQPLTWERPKVLLPLVNVPMLEYTVEFLAQNGIEEVSLYAYLYTYISAYWSVCLPICIFFCLVLSFFLCVVSWYAVVCRAPRRPFCPTANYLNYLQSL